MQTWGRGSDALALESREEPNWRSRGRTWAGHWRLFGKGRVQATKPLGCISLCCQGRHRQPWRYRPRGEVGFGGAHRSSLGLTPTTQGEAHITAPSPTGQERCGMHSSPAKQKAEVLSAASRKLIFLRASVSLSVKAGSRSLSHRAMADPLHTHSLASSSQERGRQNCQVRPVLSQLGAHLHPLDRLCTARLGGGFQKIEKSLPFSLSPGGTCGCCLRPGYLPTCSPDRTIIRSGGLPPPSSKGSKSRARAAF